MTKVWAVTLTGMQQEMERLTRIGMNIANASTPGYKREVAAIVPAAAGSFADAVAAVREGGASAMAGPLATAGTALHVQSDLSAGTLKATGQRLDLALAGPGFFEVRTATGVAYTRQGNWHLDVRGRLVTAQGDPVMGRGGGEIVLNHTNPVIDAVGQIFEPGPDGVPQSVPVNQLKVVQFDAAQSAQLESVGNGLFASSQSPSEAAAAEVQIRQGFLENSNVSALHEMTRLMQSMRHFEALHKVTQGYDDMLGAAIRKLGELS